MADLSQPTNPAAARLRERVGDKEPRTGTPGDLAFVEEIRERIAAMGKGKKGERRGTEPKPAVNLPPAALGADFGAEVAFKVEGVGSSLATESQELDALFADLQTLEQQLISGELDEAI